MLKISKLSDYGFIIVAYLTVGKKVNASDISRDTHIPLPTVNKILKKLVSKSVLNSFKGKYGGFVLNRQKEDVSFLDVIEAIDGKFGITECAISNTVCDLQKICLIQSKIKVVDSEIKNILTSKKISSIS